MFLRYQSNDVSDAERTRERVRSEFSRMACREYSIVCSSCLPEQDSHSFGECICGFGFHQRLRSTSLQSLSTVDSKVHSSEDVRIRGPGRATVTRWQGLVTHRIILRPDNRYN